MARRPRPFRNTNASSGSELLGELITALIAVELVLAPVCLLGLAQDLCHVGIRSSTGRERAHLCVFGRVSPIVKRSLDEQRVVRRESLRQRHRNRDAGGAHRAGCGLGGEMAGSVQLDERRWSLVDLPEMVEQVMPAVVTVEAPEKRACSDG